MCYICQQGTSTSGRYKHFKGGSGGYKLWVDRQQEEINRAQQIAIQKIIAENPRLNQEDLGVQ